MHFTAQDIFLFVALVPLLIFTGKKLRGERKNRAPAETLAPGVDKLPPRLVQKIESDYYRDGKAVLLAAFDSDVEANIVRGLLIEHDIYAELRDEILGATRFNYSYVVGGVKLFVHESELTEAKRLLAEHREITRQDSDEWKIRTCPVCGSDVLNFQKYHPLSALVLFLGAPFIPVKAGRWVCLKCGHKWKEKPEKREN